MKRFISIITALTLLGLNVPVSAYAAPPPVIRESVGVCDYNAPTHCAAPNSDGSFNTKVTAGTYPSTNASGTVTLGGTYQTVFASNTSRKGCLIENPTTATEILNVRQGGTAVWTIAIGGSFSCAYPGGIVSDLIEVTAATTAHAFTAVSQ